MQRRMRPRRPASPTGLGLRAVALPVAVAVGVVVLLFLGYELLETTWLRDVPMERLHAVHRLRGLLASVVAASLAGWLILRAAPSLFSDEPLPGRATAPDRVTRAQRERRYAVWFVRMRWIALVTAAVLVFATIRVMHYLEPERAPALLAIIAALGAVNLGYTVALRRGGGSRRLLVVQAYGDLLALTALLHYSGGVENPLTTLMLLHVIIAGIVLSRRQCYLVATAGTVMFALMAAAEWAGTLPHYTLTVFPHYIEEGLHAHAAHDTEYVISRVGLQAAVLLLTAYFTTTITAQVQRTERQLERSAEAALAQSQTLEQALDTTGTALHVCDRELRSTWANPRWQALFGEAGAASVFAGRAESPVRRTLEDGSVRVTEVDWPPARDADRSPDGERRTYLVTTAPLLDKEGTITHVVELVRDVSDLRRIQARVARSEQLAAVGELAGKVAHEVNNPIAVISAKTRLLLSDHRAELSARTTEELLKITDLSDRVARIARGLLSYCRPSPGAPARIDIRTPIRKALAVVEATAEAAGVEIVERLPDGQPDAFVNAAEMEQVFLNLMMNALDAMPEGGRLLVSTHTAAERSGEDRFLAAVVEDTGSGMPPEIRERAFEPFLTTKPAGKGTGLGLSVCLGLVRSNRGRIELDSEPGRGTRVVVRLPLVPETAEASRA